MRFGYAFMTVGGPGNGHLTTAQQLGEVVEPLSDPPGDVRLSSHWKRDS
jgi:hypothetical protein